MKKKILLLMVLVLLGLALVGCEKAPKEAPNQRAMQTEAERVSGETCQVVYMGDWYAATTWEYRYCVVETASKISFTVAWASEDNTFKHAGYSDDYEYSRRRGELTKQLSADCLKLLPAGSQIVLTERGVQSPPDPTNDPPLRIQAAIALPSSVSTSAVAAEVEDLAKFLYTKQAARLADLNIVTTPLVGIDGYITSDPATAFPTLVASTMNDVNMNEFYKRDKKLFVQFHGVWRMFATSSTSAKAEQGWYDEEGVESSPIHREKGDAFLDHYEDWWQPQP